MSAWSRVGSTAASLALAACLLAWAPVPWPRTRLDVGAAIVAGTGVGALLFALLAATWRPPPLGQHDVVKAIAAAAPLLVLGAAAEEAIWRYAALGGISLAVGSAPALALSTVGFALAHLDRNRPRAIVSHLATGACFGAVYLASGRLLAAIAAHLAYNVLVVAACVGWPDSALSEVPT